MAVLVALVMAASLLLNGSQVLINQAAVSALLIMTLPGQGAEIDRFLDACVGGAVAIAFGLAFSFREPFAAVEEARRDALADLAAALEAIAAALAERDLGAAEAALAGSRKLDAGVDVLYDAVSEAGETAAFSPRRRVTAGGARPAGGRGAADRLRGPRRPRPRPRDDHRDPPRRPPRPAPRRRGRRRWPRRRGPSTRSDAASRAPAPTSANWARARSNWRAPPTSATRSGRR